MKKKILLLVSLMLLIAGVVSASSVNGDYKGNPIVNVISSGKTLTDEVPAQILDGKTMVPLTMLRNLGATVTWYDSNYTVDVILPSHNDKQIKNDSYMMRYYSDLQSLGQTINQVSYLTKIFNSQISDETYKNLPAVKQVIDVDLQEYDKLFNEFKTNINFYNDDDKKEIGYILSQYLTATDNYYDMLDSLKKYYENSKNQDDFQKYLDYDKVGFDASNNGIKSASNKFYQYYNKTQQ